MANELNIGLGETGLNLVAEIFSPTFTTLINLSEIEPGIYSNQTDIVGLAPGNYGVSFLAAGILKGSATLNWAGTTASNTSIPDYDSLSYNSINTADAYFALKLYSSFWATQSSDKKTAALHQAFQIINTFNYVGCKTDDSQIGEFPRKNIVYQNSALSSSVVPDSIFRAECEIAFALIKGINPEDELRGLRVTSRQLATVRTTYNPNFVPEYLENGVPSALAWSLLRPFIDTHTSRDVRVSRVS